LRRRNYAESTIRAYIRTVEHFSRYFCRPPDRLGPEHIRQYQAALFTRWKLTPNTVTQRLAALRFFYAQVFHRDLEETTIYLHLSRRHLSATCSPLDALTIQGAEEPTQNA